MEAARRNAMNLGLFLGLTLIVITTVMYAIDINLFTSSWIGITNMILTAGFGAFAAVKNKKLAGGFISFKEAFTSFFITVIIGIACSTLYMIVLFNFIDPEAKAIITENVVKYTVEMMQKFGAKAADINKMVTEMEKSDSFGLMGQLKGLFFNAIIYSIIGLVTALIVKRDRPQSI